MSLLTITKSKASIVVGVDLGTTYSGFAFAQISEPDEVHKFYEWPDLGAAGGRNYCKTQTSLLYEREPRAGSYVLKDWGYSAIVRQALGMKSQGAHVPPDPANETGLPRCETHFLNLFKLLLCPGGEGGRQSAPELPRGLTPRRVISDYLRKLSELIMAELQNVMGSHISMEDVQWCLTVPAIWDDRAKQEMKICASMAGMTKGAECPTDLMDSASPHPVMIVIEPEAASLYCYRKAKVPLNDGDMFLVVDVGGGTADLVLHEKVGAGSGLKVREVSACSGGLFGGSFVDKAFFDFLSQKISCFETFARQHRESVLKLKGWWETIKYQFDGNSSYELELPSRLGRAWAAAETSSTTAHENDAYDAIELTLDDMLNIFDPVVNGILGLVEAKVVEALNLKAMMIVGGFSGSPYLVKRIKQQFSSRAGIIVVPDEPGSAICCGAVSYGIYGADVIMSRISKKTYGIETNRPFKVKDPPHLMFQDDSGESLCRSVFHAYTRRNEEVPVDHRVCHKFYAIDKSQTEMTIGLYSSSDSDPKYVTDAGVTKEGNFLVSFPSEKELGQRPKVSISMYFGRTLVEVEVEGLNFGDGEKFKMPPVRFEKTFD